MIRRAARSSSKSSSIDLVHALLLLTLAACSALTQAAVPPAGPAAPLAPTSPPPALTPLRTEPPPPPVAAAPEPAPLRVTFHRELDVAVTALALEHAPLAAAVTRDAVWMHEARGWHEEKLPRSVRGAALAVFWGARHDALWLAGEGGLGFFDGEVWRRVADAPAPLTTVVGRGADDVWIGGERGLFRIDPRR